MKNRVIVMELVALLTISALLSLLSCRSQETPQDSGKISTEPIVIPDNKIDIPKIEQAHDEIVPVSFATKDEKKGWKITIPGNRPLATPAITIKKNLVLIGGGFGSHEFYAFDATTGKLVWQYQPADDGPTAAVIDENEEYVVFNTESCELEVLTLATGQPVWKKWLGDPLMSTPAIADGRVYMAYPDSRGDRNHYLACFDLKTGKEYWKHQISGEIITAPVIHEDSVYIATVDGTVYCFDSSKGTLAWSRKENATSSPCAWNKEVFFSTRQEITITEAGKNVQEQHELLAKTYAWGSGFDAFKKSTQQAPYLAQEEKTQLPSQKAKEEQDAGVGFAASKGDAKMFQAKENLGETTVQGIWAYQGSKPFVYKNKLLSAMSQNIKCVDPKTGEIIWQKTLKKGDTPLAERFTTPPAIVNNKCFIGTVHGDLITISADTGELISSLNVGEAIVFQPAVANGRVYIATNNGSIFCIETGDARDTGWLMWGANSRHNGLAD